MPCDCAGCCSVVKLDRFYFGGEHDLHAFVEFYTRQRRGSWRFRLKNAWRVLRGNDHHYFDCISISPEDQHRLGRFLLAAPLPESQPLPVINTNTGNVR